MKNRTKILIVLAIFLCTSLLFFSYAYIIRLTTSNNVITFGTLKMQLINNTLKDGEEVPVSDKTNIDVNDSSAISRIIRIKNVGNHPMFVRVNLDISLKGQSLTEEEIDKYITLDLGEDWIKEGDYYYYKKSVDKNEETTNLLTSISFDVAKIKNDNHNGKFDLNVNVGAVQSENNAKDVLEVRGWPE